MITLYVDISMGHFQTPDYLSGSMRLWLHLRKYSSPHVHIKLSRWNEDRREQADLIDLLCDQDCVFILGGYSHGVGLGNIWLAKELAKRGRNVTRMICTDGVHHSRYMPWRAIVSPLFGRPTIHLPDNVLHCDYWIQDVDEWYMPRGHKIESRFKDRVTFRGKLSRTHEFMDEAPEYHEEVIKCVAQYSLSS